MLSYFEAGSVDNHIGRAGAVYERDEMELFIFFLAKVDGEDVALGVLGSDMFDLHGVCLACWDLDPGLW